MPKLCHAGYVFGVRRQDNHRRWRCTSRNTNCRARGIMFQNQTFVVKGEHNHGPKLRVGQRPGYVTGQGSDGTPQQHLSVEPPFQNKPNNMFFLCFRGTQKMLSTYFVV
ncbi:hypothetical protein RUM44_009524 [Polyplax serrata]|uniref:FLYWCH-type domain-containing protein n=1 Tax=Polyplax serrata TaxID=468196 RepID=A0ABR1AUM1_POLSC